MSGFPHGRAIKHEGVFNAIQSHEANLASHVCDIGMSVAAGNPMPAAPQPPPPVRFTDNPLPQGLPIGNVDWAKAKAKAPVAKQIPLAKAGTLAQMATLPR